MTGVCFGYGGGRGGLIAFEAMRNRVALGKRSHIKFANAGVFTACRKPIMVRSV